MTRKGSQIRVLLLPPFLKPLNQRFRGFFVGQKGLFEAKADKKPSIRQFLLLCQKTNSRDGTTTDYLSYTTCITEYFGDSRKISRIIQHDGNYKVGGKGVFYKSDIFKIIRVYALKLKSLIRIYADIVFYHEFCQSVTVNQNDLVLDIFYIIKRGLAEF